MVNVTACRAVADLAERSASQHFQFTVFSDDLNGSTAGEIRSRIAETDVLPAQACLAGMACILGAPENAVLEHKEDEGTHPAILIIDEKTHFAMDWAEEYLGLPHDEAFSVFYCFSNPLAIERLREIADRAA